MQREPAGDATALSKVWENMGFQRKFWQTTRLIVPGFWATRLVASLLVAAVVSTAAAVMASGFTTWWFEPPAIPQNAFLTSDELPKYGRPKSYWVRRDYLRVEDSSILVRVGMQLDSTPEIDSYPFVQTDPLPAAIQRRYELWWARLNERFAGAGIRVYMMVIEAGFPFRAVEGSSIWAAPPEVAKFWAADFPRLRMLSGDPNGFIVYGPLWWGLVGNVLCWGLPLFAVLSLLERQRRRYYAKAGLCEKCNYEVGAMAKCPECGTPGGLGGPPAVVSAG